MSDYSISVPGGELYTRVDGSGPAVVMIHAGIAHSDMWQPQVEGLAGRWTLVRYDTRGFGRSRSEPVSFSNRDDLRDVLDHLGISRAVLVGCSRGGQIAIDFALETPERVAGLVPVCAGVGGFVPSDDIRNPALDELFTLMGQLEEAGRLDEVNEYEMQVFVDGFGQSADRVQGEVRAWVKEMNRINLEHLQHGDQPTPIQLEPPAITRLKEIQVPTLVMVSDLDTPAILAIADQLATEIPRAEKVIFQGAAHLPNLEQPERFNRELADFLARLGW